MPAGPHDEAFSSRAEPEEAAAWQAAAWQAAAFGPASNPAPPQQAGTARAGDVPLLDLKAPGPAEAHYTLPLPGSSHAPATGQRWRTATRVWAVLKMSSFGWTTWWLAGMAKAGLGTEICIYGLACFFAGMAGRWRKRWFGPGQLLEPELYEEVGSWLYRLGTVLVLVGGALYVIELVR